MATINGVCVVVWGTVTSGYFNSSSLGFNMFSLLQQSHCNRAALSFSEKISSIITNTIVECVLKVLASALYFALYVTTGFTNAVLLKSKLASAINFKCKACLDPQVSDDDYKAV